MNRVVHLIRAGRAPLPDAVAEDDLRVELHRDDHSFRATTGDGRNLDAAELIAVLFEFDRAAVW